MPADYERFLTTVGPQPDRLWRQFAVGYIIGPSEVWPQLQAIPSLKGNLTPVMSFNESGGTVVPTLKGQSGEHVLAKINTPAPRYALIAAWKGASDEVTLADLSDPSKPLFETAYLEMPAAAKLPVPSGRGMVGKVEVQDYRSGAVTLHTASDQPSVLRISEYYHPEWKVLVDGNTSPLLRCDFLFQGVFVPAGKHNVALKYAPPVSTLLVQFAGMGFCAIAVLVLLLQRLLGKSKIAAA